MAVLVPDQKFFILIFVTLFFQNRTRHFLTGTKSASYQMMAHHYKFFLFALIQRSLVVRLGFVFILQSELAKSCNYYHDWVLPSTLLKRKNHLDMTGMEPGPPA